MIRPAPGETERARVADALRATLEAQPEIRFACLHGSFARGEPYRDIDVAIWVDAALVICNHLAARRGGRRDPTRGAARGA